MRYRKKEIEVEAFRFQIDEIAPDWFMDAVTENKVKIFKNGCCIITTLNGPVLSFKTDYIIKGVNDEIYPCKAEIFNETYVKIDYDIKLENDYKYLCLMWVNPGQVKEEMDDLKPIIQPETNKIYFNKSILEGEGITFIDSMVNNKFKEKRYYNLNENRIFKIRKID